MAEPLIQRVVGPSPHIVSAESGTKIMLWVVGALTPAALWAVISMGTPAIITLVAAIAAAVLTEAVWNGVARKPQTLTDGTALLTGLLLAMTMPPRTPWWITVAAAIVAIALGKMLFGGLGWNIFNPALVGRAFATLSWAGVLTATTNRGWFRTLSLPAAGDFDAVSGATRLGLAAADRAASGAYHYNLAAQYQPLLFRNLEGSLGEVSAALLILGGLVLILRGIIDWRIPVGYIGTMGVLSWAFGTDPVFSVLAGGVMLGAFFMATDYVTSPMNRNARLAFGIGCGAFNAIGRSFGSMPEVTTYAILFMNGLAPMLDKMFRPKVFGAVKAE